MTPQLETAITAIQLLSPSERQQLLSILAQKDSVPKDNEPVREADLKTLSAQFQQGVSLNQILSARIPKTVHDLNEFAAEFWPEEETTESFLSFLQQQRQEFV